MKKISIISIITACLLFSFIGCQNPANATGDQNKNQTQDEEPQDNKEDDAPEEEEQSTSLFNKGDIYAIITEESSGGKTTEYLSFTSSTGGNYYIDTLKYSVFEYDEDLNALIIGIKPYYILSHKGKLYWADGYGLPKSGNSLIGEWNIGIATVTFKKDGTVKGSNKQGQNISGTYTYNDGIVTYIDDNDEGDNAIFYYSPEGRLYTSFQQMYKVLYVGAIPVESELVVTEKDHVGIEYASLTSFNPSSGVYGFYTYSSSREGKTIDTTYYLNFANSELSAKEIITAYSQGYFTKTSLNNGKILKIQMSSTTWYMVKLADGSIYLYDSEFADGIEKTDSSDGFYGSYSFEYKGYSFDLTFNNDGSISGKDSNGEISGVFSIQNGLVQMILNAIDANSCYISMAITGIYYNDGEKPVFILDATKVLQADSVGGKLYSTIEETLDLLNYVDAGYKLPEISSYEVGDLVCEDGTVIRISEGKYFIPSGKNPIAVIYKVTDNGKTGVGLGLKEASKAWATEATTGYSNFMATRLNDGSENWNIICNTDPSGTAAAGDNYPMFYWVEQYGLNYYPTSIYSDSWYIPSLGDFIQIYNNKDYIDNLLKALDGSGLNGVYWTSCQYKHESFAYFGITYNYSGTSSFSTKSDSHKVRAVHKFYIE